MIKKPMLAVDCGGIENVKFPVIASPKLDGVRALIGTEGVLSRSLKLIPNRRVQKLLGRLPYGLDGELIAGDPCDPDVYRKTVSMVMSEDAEIDGLKFHVFDAQGLALDGFEKRLEQVRATLNGGLPGVVIVPHVMITTAEALEEQEAYWLSKGYEGVMLRKPDGPYKHGRSTLREGYLLKLKRFKDSEAEVLGVTELMHNANEAKVNALGHTERSSHKAGKVGRGVLGALVVRDVKTGVEFEIGTGFTADERRALWAGYTARVDRGVSVSPIGQIAKYKYFPTGSKDRPRFPVFIGWRSPLDT